MSCKLIHERREQNFDKNAADLQEASNKTAFQERAGTTHGDDVFTGAERALLVPADDQQTPAFCMLLYRLFHSHHKEKLLQQEKWSLNDLCRDKFEDHKYEIAHRICRIAARKRAGSPSSGLIKPLTKMEMKEKMLHLHVVPLE